MAGTATRNLRFLAQLCGDEALANCALVTGMWDLISAQVGAERENELRTKDAFFKPMLSHGATLFRHNNTLESAQKVIRGLLKKTPMPLEIQRELVDEKKRVFETKAGDALLGEIAELERKHQEELKRLEEELAEVQQQQDEEAQQEIEEARRELLEQTQRLEQERAKIRSASMTAIVHQSQPQPQPQPQVNKLAQLWISFRRFFRPYIPCISSESVMD